MATSAFHVFGVWEAPQCADSGESLAERPLQLGRKSEIRSPKFETDSY